MVKLPYRSSAGSRTLDDLGELLSCHALRKQYRLRPLAGAAALTLFATFMVSLEFALVTLLETFYPILVIAPETQRANTIAHLATIGALWFAGTTVFVVDRAMWLIRQPRMVELRRRGLRVRPWVGIERAVPFDACRALDTVAQRLPRFALCDTRGSALDLDPAVLENGESLVRAIRNHGFDTDESVSTLDGSAEVQCQASLGPPCTSSDTDEEDADRKKEHASLSFGARQR